MAVALIRPFADAQNDRDSIPKPESMRSRPKKSFGNAISNSERFWCSMLSARKMHMAQILVVGGVTYDDLVYLERFPTPQPQTLFSQKHHTTVGGTGAGKALNLHRLGHHVTLHTLLGDDPAGRLVRSYFEREGLQLITEIDPQGTERHINLMDAAGDRMSIYVNYATFEPLIDHKQLTALINASDVVALNIINYCRYLIPLINNAQKPLWIDIHDYDGQATYHQAFVDAADVLFLSSDRMPDYRAFMQRMLTEGKQIVVCTHGKRGATALSPLGWVTIPALTAEVVDTNGAGDSFFSGFLHGYLQGEPLLTCMRYGALVARMSVTSPELCSDQLNLAALDAAYRTTFVMP
jgi:sugar/nucleoside kinase (ribokinase family)